MHKICLGQSKTYSEMDISKKKKTQKKNLPFKHALRADIEFVKACICLGVYWVYVKPYSLDIASPSLGSVIHQLWLGDRHLAQQEHVTTGNFTKWGGRSKEHVTACILKSFCQFTCKWMDMEVYGGISYIGGSGNWKRGVGVAVSEICVHLLFGDPSYPLHLFKTILLLPL